MFLCCPIDFFAIWSTSGTRRGLTSRSDAKDTFNKDQLARKAVHVCQCINLEKAGFVSEQGLPIGSLLLAVRTPWRQPQSWSSLRLYSISDRDLILDRATSFQKGVKRFGTLSSVRVKKLLTA